jgi:hypothetical protein
VIGGVDENQRRDAEGRVHDQRCEERVAGDGADGLTDTVQEIADGPEKNRKTEMCKDTWTPYMNLFIWNWSRP